MPEDDTEDLLRGAPIRLLVTGFGPFPGVRDNPSERLVRRIAASRRLRRIPGDLRTAVLPTAWEPVRLATPQLLAEHDPELVLHLGVHTRADGFRIERWASTPDSRTGL